MLIRNNGAEQRSGLGLAWLVFADSRVSRSKNYTKILYAQTAQVEAHVSTSSEPTMPVGRLCGDSSRTGW